ncbi:MAG: insulinase family protein [Chloroflexi bacterium]|nr:insulinase family protein [Chloroflexota bacterium]
MQGSLAITPERVVRQRLPNGLVILVIENQASASVALQGQFLAGSQFEAPEHCGLASLTAAMLRRGTRQHTFQGLNQILDGAGASLGSYANERYAVLGGRALASDLGLLLNLAAEMLREPAMDATEFAKARGQILTNLGIYLNDTGYRASSAFDKALYGPEHPFGRETIGTPESLISMQQADLTSFYERIYHPAQGILAVSGAVRADEVAAHFERLFGDWQPPHQPPQEEIPPVAPPKGVVRVDVPLADKLQADLVWGTLGIARDDQRYYAARMGDMILGQLGMMGRLGNRVRDELGLAYYAGSRLERGAGPVSWEISAGINPADLERTLSEIDAVVQGMRAELVSEAELADCQSYLVGSMPLGLETNTDLVAQLVAIETHQLGFHYLQRFPELIHAVTREDILAAMQCLDPANHVVAISGTL